MYIRHFLSNVVVRNRRHNFVVHLKIYHSSYTFRFRYSADVLRCLQLLLLSSTVMAFVFIWQTSVTTTYTRPVRVCQGWIFWQDMVLRIAGKEPLCHGRSQVSRTNRSRDMALYFPSSQNRRGTIVRIIRVSRLLLVLEAWNFHCDLPWHRGSYPAKYPPLSSSDQERQNEYYIPDSLWRLRLRTWP